MSYSSKILLDSISPLKQRLLTLELTFPRIVLAEFSKHRMFSFNSASSRAIPFKKMVERVQNDMFVPIEFGREQKGMQTGEPILDADSARYTWIDAGRDAIRRANQLHELGVHKAICNRLIEPFSWITIIITATDWNNFFRLRRHIDAEVHIRKIADLAYESIQNSTPKFIDFNSWHLPLIQDDEQNLDIELKKKVSVARAARVSYLCHNGTRSIDKDIELYNRLVCGSDFGHWSSFEHAATPTKEDCYMGNLHSWKSFRKEFSNESGNSSSTFIEI